MSQLFNYFFSKLNNLSNSSPVKIKINATGGVSIINAKKNSTGIPVKLLPVKATEIKSMVLVISPITRDPRNIMAVIAVAILSIITISLLQFLLVSLNIQVLLLRKIYKHQNPK